MSFRGKIILWIGLLLCHFGLTATNNCEHPRGLITRSKIDELRIKVKSEPFMTWLNKMHESTLESEQGHNPDDPYETAYLALKQAQLYIVTGKEVWAKKSFVNTRNVITDSIYFLNPVSRGLTRATQLFCIAQCYDFCYNAWNQEQRDEVNEKMFQAMITVNSNMGFSANYALESNWNGIRWSSVLMAALVFDYTGSGTEKNPALPFVWDVQRRLQEHISQNIFPDGWNSESLSYHVYNWSFIAPALAALQNHNPTPLFRLENYAPHALKTIHSWSAATVSILHPGGKGIQPDFSDDDPQGNYVLTALALGVYPRNQLPAIKWMHDYLLDVNLINDNRGYLFYSLCWYPSGIQAVNPSELGWQTFIGRDYGIALWRNRFCDENDIVVAFNAPLKRLSGHKGPDNLSFRIIGLGNIWITGGGRTQQSAGQTSLFAAEPEPGDLPEGPIPACNWFSAGQSNHYFYARAMGSCMNVINHTRKIETVYNGASGDSASVRIIDTSDNGRIWRMNTPEFNDVQIIKNGFILTAPNGRKMTAVVKSGQITGTLKVSRIRYGGNTTSHNSGIGMGNQYWMFNKAIDIPCNQNLEIVLTLH